MEFSEILGGFWRKADWLLLLYYETYKFKNHKTYPIIMFGLFKKKSEKEKLQDRYKKLMEEAYKLQSVNRSQSDEKYAEADAILKQIDALGN